MQEAMSDAESAMRSVVQECVSLSSERIVEQMYAQAIQAAVEEDGLEVEQWELDDVNRVKDQLKAALQIHLMMSVANFMVDAAQVFANLPEPER